MPEVAKSHGSQAIIVGDLIEYILIHAQELGLNVIQTVHSNSEIPGIKNQYELIRKNFPETPVFYFNGGSQYFKSFKPKII